MRRDYIAYPQGASDPALPDVYVCKTCGVLVAEIDAHDEFWHDEGFDPDVEPDDHDRRSRVK